MIRLARLGSLICMIFALGYLYRTASAQISFPQLHPPFAQAADDTWVQTATPSRMLWVSSVGHDNSDGMSLQTAWHTLAHAVGLMQPGDILQVVASPNPYTASISLGMSAKGTDVAPKVIRGVDTSGNLAQPGQRPLIIPATSKGFPFELSTEYWILEGLSIDCKQSRTAVESPRLVGIYILSNANHIAIQHSAISNCQNSAIEIRESKDVKIADNVLDGNVNPAQTASGGDDSNGITINKNSERIHIKDNEASGNSADGVQCEGGEGVVKDLTIEDNTFHDNGENAVDIKGCQRVDIIGGTYYGFSQPATVTAPSCGGVAVIIHNSPQGNPASSVLIERNDIYGSGIGVSLGRSDSGYLAVQNVVLRRNLIHGITAAKGNCGDGVWVQHVTGAEIYHNTFDSIDHAAIYVRGQGNDNDAVGVANNIISNVAGTANSAHHRAKGGALDFELVHMSNFASMYNLFFQSTSGPLLFYEANAGSVNFQQWQALGLDVTGSAEGDPKYKSTTGPDAFVLDVMSPGLNTALPDWYNRQQQCNGAPDKGAIESDCLVAPPSPSVTVTSTAGASPTASPTATPVEEAGVTQTAMPTATANPTQTPAPSSVSVGMPRTGESDSSALLLLALITVIMLLALGGLLRDRSSPRDHTHEP